MFKGNDRSLHVVYTVGTIIICLSALAYFIGGIILAVYIHPSCCLISFIMPFFVLFVWICFRLFISYLVDVKLIRNKLYDCDNSDLEGFYKRGVQSADENQQPTDKEAEREQRLRIALHRYETGVIDKKAYNSIVEKIMEVDEE